MPPNFNFTIGAFNMAKEKITGEQIERILDVCNQHDKFDYFFAPKKNNLTDQESIVLQEIFAKRESLKNDFKPTEQESNVWKKVIEQSQAEEYEFKKTLLLNKDLSKSLFAILEPELEYDIKKSSEIIARGLVTVKAELGL
jgi:hypothetical protein